MRYFKLLILLTFILFLSPAASAQMPPVPGGHVHIGPPYFQGMELAYSTPTVNAYSMYGDYWFAVVPGAAGVGLWEQANSYRGGGASLEPILIVDGVPLLVQDVTATFYNALIHDGVDANYDTNTGSHRFFMTGAGNGLEVHTPGIAPGVNLLRVDIRHSGGGGDGFIESITGDMGIRPANGSNVGILDSTGGADDYYFPDGDGLANQALFTDGVNNVTFQYEHSKTALALAIDYIEITDIYSSVFPAYLWHGLVPTATNLGITQCRDGSVTGIGISATAVVIGNPISVDDLAADVYINGVAIGNPVIIPHTGLPVSVFNVQAILADQFVAGDVLTIGLYYVNNGGPATIFFVTELIGTIEVHYD